MRSVLFFALLVAAIGSGAALAAAPSPQQQVAKIESATSQIRGLRPLHAVKTELLGDAAFDRAYRTYVRGLTPDGEIEVAQKEAVLLGELSKSANLKKIYLQNSVNQFVGLYDYQQATLYIRDTGGRALGVDRDTIAHEYAHALQDQHFHLAALIPDQFPLTYRNSDAVAAHHALTEGDAVTTQIQYIRWNYSRKDLSALLKEESQPIPGPALPKILERELNFPYTTGLSFVQALYTLRGFGGVNAAYHRLPASTYEIMHPSAYLHFWQPLSVDLHGVQGFADWQQVDDDVFGAEGYNDLLWQHLGSKKANSVTDHYRGDRYIFLEKGTDAAMRLDSVWTDAATAKAARDGFLQALRNRFKHPHVSHLGPTWSVQGGGLAIDVIAAGVKLSVAYASTPILAAQLVAAPTT